MPKGNLIAGLNKSVNSFVIDAAYSLEVSRNLEFKQSVTLRNIGGNRSQGGMRNFYTWP